MFCIFSILLPQSKHVRLTDYVVTRKLVSVCVCPVTVQSADLPLPHVGERPAPPMSKQLGESKFLKHNGVYKTCKLQA